MTKLSTTTESQSADYASIGNLLFGFPVTGWWKASFGLLPYSATGYKMTDHQVDTVFDNYNNSDEIKISSILNDSCNVGKIFNLDIITLTAILNRIELMGYIKGFFIS